MGEDVKNAHSFLTEFLCVLCDLCGWYLIFLDLKNLN